MIDVHPPHEPLFVNMADNGPFFTAAQAAAIQQKIEVLQGQLILVDALVQDLSQEYKRFLAAHPQ